MEKNKDRITNTYGTTDPSSLDDFIVCIMATVEDGFIKAGLSYKDKQYSLDDILLIANPIIKEQWIAGNLSYTINWP